MYQRQDKKKTGLAILLLLLFLISFISTPNILAEEIDSKESSYFYRVGEEDRIDVSLSYGYEGNAKYGRYMGIRLAISNASSDFTGRIEVMVPKQENNTKYGEEIQVNKGENKEFYLTVPVTDDTGLLQVKILDERNKIQLEEYFPITIGNYVQETYIGVLSNHKDGLNYLDTIGTKVFYLEEESVPKDYLGLDLLDVIVINEFDSKVLSSMQLEAIEKWVMNGGTLVLGTGEYYKEVIAGLNSKYFHEEDENIKEETISIEEDTIATLEETISSYLEKRRMLYENIRGRNEVLRNKGLETILVDNSTLSDEAKEIINKFKAEEVKKAMAPIGLADGEKVRFNKLLIMEELMVGKGSIQLFPFNLSLSDEYATTGYKLLTTILDHLSDTKKNQLEYEYYGDYVNYNIMGSMSYTDTNNIPNIVSYFVILLLYIVIVGPVTYIILRKIDKRSLTWVLVPIVAIVFTLIIYFVGNKTRIESPYVSYIELLTYDKNNTVLDEVYFSFTSPSNDAYTTKLDKKFQIKELRDSSYNYYMDNLNPKNKSNLLKYITSITNGLEDTIIKVEQNPAFTPIYYQARDTYRGLNKLTSDITYFGDKLIGTVNNGFDFNLNNAILVSDGYLVNLGNIEKGEVVSLEGKESLYVRIRDEIYDGNYFAKLAGGDETLKQQTSEVRRKSSILTYIVENNLSGFNKNFVIGFVDSMDVTEGGYGNQLIHELDNKMDAYGAKVLLLPVDVNHSKENKTFVSSISPYLNLEGESDDKYFLRYYLKADKTYEYMFPAEEVIASLHYLESRNQELKLDYVKSFKGSIYFYNHNENAYEEVFANKDSVTNVTDYIKEGRLLVKYEADISLKGNQVITPNISYWKEGEDARD